MPTLLGSIVGDPSIFDFSNYRDFLSVRTRQGGKRKRPLERWARILGYRSPRSIAMVLNGQRLPSAEMVLRISKQLGLSANERYYFELLVSLERNRKSPADVSKILDELERIHPKFPGQAFVEPGTFSNIARWYYLVVKQLVETPAFQEDPHWIRNRLRKKINLAEVRNALAQLLRLGLIQRDESGRLKAAAKHISTTADIPSAAIRSHHHQMLCRAIEALTEQTVDRREFTSITLRFDADKIAAAKQRIRDFRDSFNKEFSCPRSNEVWQMNIQLFEHTARQPNDKAN